MRPLYESGPVQYPKNMTIADVGVVGLQQEGGFSTEQMKKIMKYVVTIRCYFVTIGYFSVMFRHLFVTFQVP